MDFDGFSLKIHEKSWIFMISQGVLGNLGVNLIHPPKLCARLSEWTRGSPFHTRVPKGHVLFLWKTRGYSTWWPTVRSPASPQVPILVLAFLGCTVLSFVVITILLTVALSLQLRQPTTWERACTWGRTRVRQHVVASECTGQFHCISRTVVASQ